MNLPSPFSWIRAMATHWARERTRRRLNRVDGYRGGKQRILFGAVMFGLCFLVLASQLTAVVLEGRATKTTFDDWEERQKQRADIVDRNGRMLATNAQTHSLYAHPYEMSAGDVERIMEEFVVIFPDLDLERLGSQLNPNRKFVWIRSRISPRQMQAVNEIGVPGLHFGKREARIYPNGKLGSHVLGGTKYGVEDVKWAEIVGVRGVEKELEPLLLDLPEGKQELLLSVDLRLQGIVEEVLAHGVKLYHARSGSAVLMDANTGEVLSLASYPDFDPNNRDEYFRKTKSDHGPLFNNAVQGLFELGSTFKIFAAAQALDLGLVNTDTLIDTRKLRIGGRVIKDYLGDGEPITVEQVIVKSSNVGAARLGIMIGKARQRQFMERLGFGEPTGLEVSESRISKPILPARWGELSTVTISFGHGLAISPVHLATAYASIVNGGCKVVPTILRVEVISDECDRVVSKSTSRQVSQLLGEVVNSGTATKARMDTVSVGGKTGTADKVHPNGGYYDDRVIATFASVFPIEQPQFVLVLTLDEPTTNDGSKWQRGAGNTAVPVAAEIISRVSPFLLAKRIADESEDDPASDNRL